MFRHIHLSTTAASFIKKNIKGNTRYAISAKGGSLSVILLSRTVIKHTESADIEDFDLGVLEFPVSAIKILDEKCSIVSQIDNVIDLQSPYFTLTLSRVLNTTPEIPEHNFVSIKVEEPITKVYDRMKHIIKVLKKVEKTMPEAVSSLIVKKGRGCITYSQLAVYFKANCYDGVYNIDAVDHLSKSISNVNSHMISEDKKTLMHIEPNNKAFLNISELSDISTVFNFDNLDDVKECITMANTLKDISSRAKGLCKPDDVISIIFDKSGILGSVHRPNFTFKSSNNPITEVKALIKIGFLLAEVLGSMDAFVDVFFNDNYIKIRDSSCLVVLRR